ncbi:RmlC-like cupin, partial [Atractiella rhizophila]
MLSNSFTNLILALPLAFAAPQLSQSYHVQADLNSTSNQNTSGHAPGHEGATAASWSADAIADQVKQLYAASTNNQRYEILGANGLAFDFFAAPSFAGGGKDGGVVLADNTQWPGVVGTGSAMLVGTLGPCGMIAPHNHPRATEILINIVGPDLIYGSIPQGGSEVIMGKAAVGQVALLPKGSYHFVQNGGCTPTVIVAGFNDESPGALFVSQAYAAFDEETYEAAFGASGLVMLDPAEIPNTVNLGADDCLKMCGIDRSYDISNVTKEELFMQSLAGYLKSINYTASDYPQELQGLTGVSIQ